MSGSVFPIEILKVSMDHEGGTKSYHLIMARSKTTGKGLLVLRFGKKGREGQIQALCYVDGASTLRAFNQKFKEKSGRGYEEVDRKTIEAGGPAQLKNAIGLQLFYKLGKAAIEHLAPGIDTSGVTDETVEDSVVIDKDGNQVPATVNTRTPRVIKEKEPTTEERVAADPLWGLF